MELWQTDTQDWSGIWANSDSFLHGFLPDKYLYLVLILTMDHCSCQTSTTTTVCFGPLLILEHTHVHTFAWPSITVLNILHINIKAFPIYKQWFVLKKKMPLWFNYTLPHKRQLPHHIHAPHWNAAPSTWGPQTWRCAPCAFQTSCKMGFSFGWVLQLDVILL